MPKLWSETIEEHRHEVSDAILDATVMLVARRGLHAVTMSQVAEETGIGRATLYKHFPDVGAILVAWHHRHVAGHLERLAQIRDEAGGARERVETVLEAYALLTFEHPRGTELAALVHRGEQPAEAQPELTAFMRDLLAGAARVGAVRDDVAPEELASYCLHALGAAGSLASKAAVSRLVTVTLAGLHVCAERAQDPLHGLRVGE